MESSKMMSGQKCANDTQTEGTHNSTEENKLHESNIGFAEEIFLQLGISDQNFKMWNQKMDNLEEKEANCCQCRFDSGSPLETSFISFTKEEKSLATESASSEVSQDEMKSNNYKGENTDTDCDGRLLCLNNLEKYLCYLDLSSPSETFSSDGDAEESIMKDEIFSPVKHSRDSTGDEMKDVLRRDQLKRELWRNDIKAEELQDDEISEDDTENPVIFSGEESSAASVNLSGWDVVKKQQSTAIKIPKRNGQTEGTSRHVEITHSAGRGNCCQTVRLQVRDTWSEDEGADLEEISQQYREVLQEQVTSPKCDIPKIDPVDKTSNKEQLVISSNKCSTTEMPVHNQNILLAKDTIEDSAVIVKNRLKKILWHLSEIEEDNRNIHFQIIKLNAEYRQIQEYHQCMTCDNKTLANQGADLQIDRNSTAAQNAETLCGIDKLERRIQVALNNLSEIKMEKNSLEQQFQSLKEVYNSREEARIEEREHLTKGYSRPASTIEVLRVQSGSELVHTEKLNQEIAALISENCRLQQVTEVEMEKSKLALQDAKKWKKNLDKLTAKHQEKEKQSNTAIQMLKMEMDALKETSNKKERKIKQNMKMLAHVILDMKLVHSDLSAKGPSDKGDCANSTCVKKTSQILSKIDGILSSMEEIFVCQKSNACSDRELPFGNSDSKGVGDLKERVPARNDRSRRLNYEIWLQECKAIDSEVRESLSRPAGSRKISKHESVQKRIMKRMEECKMLAAENVKLHNCVQELVCKVNGFNKIIQYADQRLQMNNLHILRLEKKNSILLVALNKMASKKELRESFSPESTSDSSRASEKLHCSWTKENNSSETGVCSAKGLEMCDYQNQKEILTLDNPEFAEGICSQNFFDKTSQQDVYSISRRKDELCFEAETISTLTDISQDDGDHSSNEEKNDTNWNPSYCGNDVDKIIPKEDILNKKTAKVVENDEAANHQGKSSDEFKLLVAENIELHTRVDELQSKIDGLNEIVQIADQRLRMFNMQIIGLEKKNSALIAALNKKIKTRTSS